MRRKVIIIYIIIRFLFMCVGVGQVNATNGIDNKIIVDTTSWTDVFVALIALINLIFVVVFYINDQKNRKIDHKTEYMFFWYKNYVLKEAFKIIEEHMKNCENIINDCQEYKLSEPTVQEYNKYLKERTMLNFDMSNNNTKNRISELLKVIDKDISNEIAKNFRDIQDIFTEKIQNVSEEIYSLYGEIEEKKPILMNTLYNYGLDILNEKNSNK